jgi:hypothetical protein
MHHVQNFAGESRILVSICHILSWRFRADQLPRDDPKAEQHIDLWAKISDGDAGDELSVGRCCWVIHQAA